MLELGKTITMFDFFKFLIIFFLFNLHLFINLLFSDNNYILKDLQPDTEYEVRVATRNKAGISEFTYSSIFKTVNHSSSIYFATSSYLIANLLGIVMFSHISRWWIIMCKIRNVVNHTYTTFQFQFQCYHYVVQWQ